MKAIISILTALSFSIGLSQATIMNLADCAELIAHTDGAGVFNNAGGNNAAYKGEDKYAMWAIDGIIAAGLTPPDVSEFSKTDTSNTTVNVGPEGGFVMTHWGGGQSGDHEYQLYSLAGCEPGIYNIPSPSRNGLSWIGFFGRIPPPSVPDGGTTAALLGLAVLGMMPLKNLMRRQG